MQEILLTNQRKLIAKHDNHIQDQYDSDEPDSKRWVVDDQDSGRSNSMAINRIDQYIFLKDCAAWIMHRNKQSNQLSFRKTRYVFEGEEKHDEIAWQSRRQKRDSCGSPIRP